MELLENKRWTVSFKKKKQEADCDWWTDYCNEYMIIGHETEYCPLNTKVPPPKVIIQDNGKEKIQAPTQWQAKL